MKKLRVWATVAFVLGILALVLLLFMFLALADISHGEQDLTADGGSSGRASSSSSSSSSRRSSVRD